MNIEYLTIADGIASKEIINKNKSKFLEKKDRCK